MKNRATQTWPSLLFQPTLPLFEANPLFPTFRLIATSHTKPKVGGSLVLRSHSKELDLAKQVSFIVEASIRDRLDFDHFAIEANRQGTRAGRFELSK